MSDQQPKSRALRIPDVNRWEGAGRLTRDPELRYIQSGTAVCKLGMVVSNKYKTKSGEQREDTLFINITVWGQSAEYLGEHLQKGSPIMVDGRLSMSEWEDKATGQKRTSIEVVANRVQLLCWEDTKRGTASGGDKQGGTNYGGYSDAPKPRVIEEPIPEDDSMPF